MIRAHFDAVKARLLSNPIIAGFGVYDALRVNPTGERVAATYAVLFMGTPDELNDNRLSGPARPDSDAEFTAVVRSVSTTAGGVRAMQEQVLKTLVGHRLVVPGRVCSRISLDTGASDGVPRPDESVKPVLFTADDYFEFQSLPD